ncbi:MAG: hypothetical protein Q7S92_07195 [Candidatus Diapherotrites archaeon]|nr:hypothetical protein [Candidatus Diapherotrites archaeon]
MKFRYKFVLFLVILALIYYLFSFIGLGSAVLSLYKYAFFGMLAFLLLVILLLVYLAYSFRKRMKKVEKMFNEKFAHMQNIDQDYWKNNAPEEVNSKIVEELTQVTEKYKSTLEELGAFPPLQEVMYVLGQNESNFKQFYVNPNLEKLILEEKQNLSFVTIEYCKKEFENKFPH